jgi:hypothetical protein
MEMQISRMCCVRIRLVVADTFPFSIPSHIRLSLADWRVRKKENKTPTPFFVLPLHSWAKVKQLCPQFDGSRRVRKPLAMHIVIDFSIERICL